MRVINETHWPTAQLRALAMETARRVLEGEQRRKMTVVFNYSKRGRYSGHAYYGKVYGGKYKVAGYLVRIHLPSRNKAVTDLNGSMSSRTIAAVLAHEYLHTQGQRHVRGKGLTMCRYLSDEEIARYAWADAFPVSDILGIS